MDTLIHMSTATTTRTMSALATTLAAITLTLLLWLNGPPTTWWPPSNATSFAALLATAAAVTFGVSYAGPPTDYDETDIMWWLRGYYWFKIPTWIIRVLCAAIIAATGIPGMIAATHKLTEL